MRFSRLATKLVPPDITPDTASYQEPNKDGSQKQCGNCVFWIKSGACGLFDPDVHVSTDQICNLFIFGPPAGELLVGKLQPVDAVNAGLITPADPKGTSCSNCPAFDEGSCTKVKDASTGENAKVDALGCCNFWGGQRKESAD